MKTTNLSNAAIQAYREQYVGRLLQRATRSFNRRALEKIQNMGYANLTPLQVEVISCIPVQGTHMINLITVLGITKQALGEVVGQLEDRGYLGRSPDSKDKRASVLHFTPKGRDFLLVAYLVKQEVTQECINLLGEVQFEKLLELLEAIV